VATVLLLLIVLVLFGIAAAVSFAVSTIIDPSLPAPAQCSPAFDALGLL